MADKRETTGDPRLPDMAHDDRFAALIARRVRFAWSLTAITCAIYFGYILLIAFRRDILARPLGDGVMTLGIPVGIGVIVSGIVLTGIYVVRANRVYDRELASLRQEHGL